MKRDDSHAIRLFSCVPVPSPDDILPQHLPSSRVLLNHWNQSTPLYQKLVQTFSIPELQPSFEVNPDAEFFLDQVNADKRSLLWIPPGLGLFSHLSTFLNSQQMDVFSTQPLFHLLRRLPPTEAAWMTFRYGLYRSPEDYRESLVPESGIYPHITQFMLPSAVQIVSFLATHLLLGNEHELALYSSFAKNMRFLRSSTTILDELAHVSVAFLPGQGIYLDAYALDQASHLHTADLFVLPTP